MWDRPLSAHLLGADMGIRPYNYKTKGRVAVFCDTPFFT